ncbi:hypothetical protein AA103196_1419 [Ameyamaea chiangmaiensis NBRC 103196]|uniref:Alginate export family protein n=1 Tax=Ameyamaea chiangmaiensis TaxID=442969 RepID=A0A850PEF3_9PROT|nr:alginate export family protein [Ameyamaea chiangmaiensis]MBS4075241.1 alginate export family protein [Ameyamaea chiangmaiensis]NVN41243.1 alginate export family protein [Ameyamaea chiangmaiensis]GBQ66512.1 hypothetical protein AA103196_1419 [Ameyamaea chiangmaiensis NBRC 103196]
MKRLFPFPLGMTLSALLLPASPASADDLLSPDRRDRKDIRGDAPAEPAFLGPWGVFNAQKGQASGWGPVDSYAQARWSEDWSGVKLSSRPNDVFDRLKRIPLSSDGTVTLTLNGEERLRGYYDSHPALGTRRPGRAFRVLLRSLYGADLQVGTHVRLYAELANGTAGGSNYYGYDGYQRSRLDLQQGFLELRQTLFGSHAGVMIGRQYFLDAPPYVLSVRDLPNIPQSWNGIRGYAFWHRFRLDTFGFLRTDPKPQGVFANRADWHTRLFGVYGSYALPQMAFMPAKSSVFADVFYYGYLYRGAASATASASGVQLGATRRDTVGTRLWGTLGPYEISLGALYQGGVFHPENATSRPIRAYAINGSVTRSFAGVIGKPAVGVQVDLFSGGDASGRTVRTYAAPYYNAPFYNDVTTYMGPQNALSAGPVGRWTPIKGISVRVHVPVFWRASTRDALYGTNQIYPLDRSAGRLTGVLPQAGVSLALNRHLTWSHDFAAFCGSAAWHRAGARDGQFYMQTLDFRF